MFRITPLLVGLRSADQGMMTYQSDYGKPIWLPMWSFLLQDTESSILVDTGLDDFMVPPDFVQQTGLEPQSMEDALAAQGLSPDDITIVVNTHLHDDHCANNPLFQKARFYVQKKEIEICRNPHPLDDRYDDTYIQDLDLVPVEGDYQLLTGLTLLYTPGHTPGCQTVQVRTDSGMVIIPGFCCNAKNFPSGKAVCPGVHSDAFQAYDSAQRVSRLEGLILPLHEVKLPKFFFVDGE